MAGPEPGGAFCDVRRERLDPDTQVGHEAPDDGDRLRATTRGINEDLGVGTRREDQHIAARLTESGRGRGVVGVARVEQRDDDARVEDDYRHSRRSFWSDPFG